MIAAKSEPDERFERRLFFLNLCSISCRASASAVSGDSVELPEVASRLDAAEERRFFSDAPREPPPARAIELTRRLLEGVALGPAPMMLPASGRGEGDELEACDSAEVGDPGETGAAWLERALVERDGSDLEMNTMNPEKKKK